VTRLVGADDVLVFGGLAAIGAGVWFIFAPAAPIVGGAGLVALGLLRSRARRGGAR